jgi:hypothetical protein
MRTIFLAGKSSANWSGIRPSNIISQKKIGPVASQIYMPASSPNLSSAPTAFAWISASTSRKAS